MSQEGKSKKCFTFIWKLENASFCWQGGECMDSPLFQVEELDKSKWKLRLQYLHGDKNGAIFFRLQREDSNGVERVQIDYELCFLAPDGTVLKSHSEIKRTFGRNDIFGSSCFARRNEVFFSKRSIFLPQDTLTARCRMWKSAGEFSKEVQCFARTRLVVEKRSLLWKIENASAHESDERRTYEIKAQDTDEKLLCLELFLSKRKILDETLRIALIHNSRIKTSFYQLFVMDDSNNIIECFQDEFSCNDSSSSRKEFDLFLTKKRFMEKKAAFLQNDVLFLKCEFSFSLGIIKHEETRIIHDCATIENEVPDDHCFLTENNLPVPRRILIDDLKSMLNDDIHCDIKLKTDIHCYPAHKCILSARSPVFKAMLSSDMKEKIDNCVDIGDLKDDTVLRMLQYIYSAEVEDLDWTRASDLYEAAHKYQILNLKDICSSYLKNNLLPSNACKALVLADLHHDEDLKSFVQDFITSYHTSIINSDEWNRLMESRVDLAAETMRLMFKE